MNSSRSHARIAVAVAAASATVAAVSATTGAAVPSVTADAAAAGYPTHIVTLAALGVQKSVTGYLSGSLASLPPGFSAIKEVSPQYTGQPRWCSAPHPTWRSSTR